MNLLRSGREFSSNILDSWHKWHKPRSCMIRECVCSRYTKFENAVKVTHAEYHRLLVNSIRERSLRMDARERFLFNFAWHVLISVERFFSLCIGLRDVLFIYYIWKHILRFFYIKFSQNIFDYTCQFCFF